jgi:hypothetical protein
MRAYLLILCLISLVFADNQWNPKAEALSYSSILRNHDKPNHAEAHKKNFDGVSLAYVTPWNNRGNRNHLEMHMLGVFTGCIGYDVVKEFKGKFD